MMRVLLFGLVLAMGCGTAPPVEPPLPTPRPGAEFGPYFGIPSRPGDGPIATAQPVVPTGDEALDAFLAELAAAIDRNDWLAVAQKMDPTAFPGQRAFLAENGSGDAAAPQLIVETLGIEWLGGFTWEALDRIEVVTFRDLTIELDLATATERRLVDGDVRLDDGTTLPLSFSLLSRGGVFVVEVPVG